MSYSPIKRRLLLLAFLICIIAAAAAAVINMRGTLATVKNRDRMGGDVEIIQGGLPIPYDASAFLLFNSERISRVTESAAVASSKDGINARIRLKGIDAAYPLYGDFLLSTDNRTNPIFFNSSKRNVHGAAIDRRMLKALNLKLGDEFMVQEVRLVVRAIIISEPDLPLPTLDQLPTVIVNNSAFYATRLAEDAENGVVFRCRARLEPGVNLWNLKDGALIMFPDAQWQMFGAEAPKKPRVKELTVEEQALAQQKEITDQLTHQARLRQQQNPDVEPQLEPQPELQSDPAE